MVAKRIQVPSRSAAVICALAVSLTAAGCGKGSGHVSSPRGAGDPAASPGSSTPGASPTVSVGDFCNSLDDLNATAQQVGLTNRLATVRTDLDRSAAKAGEVLSAGIPAQPGVEPFLSRLASDLRNISAWVDTAATQADLDADRVPSGVRKSIDDMGYDFRQLQQWAVANCKDQQQGDGH